MLQLARNPAALVADARFAAFAAERLQLPAGSPQLRDAMLEEAQRQVAPLEALDSEAAAEGRKAAASQAAADAAGIRVQRLWVCGYCRNSNPGCPYRATRSGGWYIIVPESLVRTIEPGVAAVGLGGDYKRPS
jgi:hypothetical protein